MDSFALPHDSPPMMRTLIKRQGEIGHLFHCISGSDAAVSFEAVKRAFEAAGLIPTYLAVDELAYVYERVQHKFGDDEDGDLKPMDTEGFSALLAALGTCLPLTRELSRVDANHLGVCLLIALLAAKLPCDTPYPNKSLTCFPKDVREGMDPLENYPFVDAKNRLTIMGVDRLLRSPVLDELNMRMAIYLQSPLSHIFRVFSNDKHELNLNDLVNGLREVGLMPTYCTPSTFVPMVRRLQNAFGTPGSGAFAAGEIPVFVDPERKTVNTEGFAFILNGLVSLLRWNTKMLTTLLGNLPKTTVNLFALKMCLLVQWIYTFLTEGEVKLGPHSHACLKPIVSYSKTPTGNFQPGVLEGNPLIPLKDAGSLLSEMKEEAEAMAKPIMMRHMVTAGAGAGVTEPLVIRKPPGMVSRLRHPADVPVAMTLDGGPRPVIHRVRDLPRVLRSLWWQTFEFLESKGIMVLPLGVAGEIPKIKRLANYKLRENQERKRVAILPRDDDEKGKRDLVSAYLLLRATQQAFATQVDPPMSLPHYLGEVYGFVVADIRERGWCEKGAGGRSQLSIVQSHVLPELFGKYEWLKDNLVGGRGGGACDSRLGKP